MAPGGSMAPGGPMAPRGPMAPGSATIPAELPLQLHEVRWFHTRNSKYWLPFCGVDSLKLQVMHQMMPVLGEATPACVDVMGDLYEANLKTRTCTAIYWTGNTYPTIPSLSISAHIYRPHKHTRKHSHTPDRHTHSQTFTQINTYLRYVSVCLWCMCSCVCVCDCDLICVQLYTVFIHT